EVNFQAAVASAGRSPEIPESADAYGWLIGSWELEVLHYAGVDVSARQIKGEVHFGWVLEGRAVQDVWIMPRRSERTAGDGKDQQYVRYHSSSLGRFRPGLAYHVDQSRHRPSRRTDRALERRGRCAGRRSRQWHANALDLLRDHSRFVSLARRSPSARRKNMEARR